MRARSFRMRRAVSAILAAALVLSAPPSALSLAAPTFAAPPVRTVVPATVRRPLTVPSASPDTRLVVVRAKPGRDISRLVGCVKPVNGNYILRVPSGKTTGDYAAELSNSGDLAYATPDHISYSLGYTATPNDPDFTNSTQYNVASDDTYVPYAKSWWATGRGGTGNTASPDFAAVWPYLAVDGNAYHARATAIQVKVGVIDTGFYFNIPDAGNNIVAGKDEFQSYNHGVYVTDGDVTPNPLGDHADHGTMVASEISQAANNSIGGVGASYDTQVRVYKVQGTWVDGSPANQVVMLDSAIVNAIYDATNDGCRVINMSLGGDYNDPAIQSAIDYAYAAGVVVVAATGNDAAKVSYPEAGKVSYPGADNHVIGVGSYSLTAGGQGTPVRTYFSNWGAGLDLMAPGDSIWGPSETTPGSPGYAWWNGTSMATPLVAAAAATTIRFVPGLGPDEVAAVLHASARDIGTAGYDTANGWGCLDMEAAYAKLKADYPYLASTSISTTKTAFGAETVNLTWGAVAGRSVQYQVAIDGSAIATQAALTRAYSGLSEGTHTFSVVPTSSYNWSVGTNGATYVFTVDRTAPVVSGIAFASGQLTWSDTEGSNTHTTRVRIDSSATQTVTGNALTIPDGTLAGGSHTAYIAETDAVGNVSSTYSYGFEYVNPPVALKPVYRFKNLQHSYFLFTADEGEKATIIATLSKTWKYEGISYQINSLNTSMLWRFRNIRGGFYLFTADAAEKDRIVATLSKTWKLEGPAYGVSLDSSGAPVWRFRSKTNGTYLYTADPAEKAKIIANPSWNWRLEGTAYFLAP